MWALVDPYGKEWACSDKRSVLEGSTESDFNLKIKLKFKEV